MKKKIIKALSNSVIKANVILRDDSGDFITDHLGAFVFGALVIGIIVAAVTGWLPNFLQDVFSYVSDQILP